GHDTPPRGFDARSTGLGLIAPPRMLGGRARRAARRVGRQRIKLNRQRVARAVDPDSSPRPRAGARAEPPNNPRIRGPVRPDHSTKAVAAIRSMRWIGSTRLSPR